MHNLIWRAFFLLLSILNSIYFFSFNRKISIFFRKVLSFCADVISNHFFGSCYYHFTSLFVLGRVFYWRLCFLLSSRSYLNLSPFDSQLSASIPICCFLFLRLLSRNPKHIVLSTAPSKICVKMNTFLLLRICFLIRFLTIFFYFLVLTLILSSFRFSVLSSEMMSGKEFDGTSDLKRGETWTKSSISTKLVFSPTKFRFGRIKTRLEEPQNMLLRTSLWKCYLCIVGKSLFCLDNFLFLIDVLLC